MTQNKFFLKNINMVIKNAEFYADFEFVDPGFQKCPHQKLKAQNHEKVHKNENA